MQLIGMLDSPYVRRVAISLQRLGLPFEHHSVSVFRGYETFRSKNPVVRAPTLVCDDGTVLMDSTLILAHAESIAAPARSLMPKEPARLQRALRLLGLALAGCDKSVQFFYEGALRPAEKLHAPWADRVTEQACTAYGLLEQELRGEPIDVENGLDQPLLTAAVFWHFTQTTTPGLVDAQAHPVLRELSARAETLPEFRRAPHGEATYPVPA